jgi:hypothetical protein
MRVMPLPIDVRAVSHYTARINRGYMQIKLVLYVLALLTGVTGGAEARAHFGQVDAASLTQIGAILEASEAAPLAAPGGLALAELPANVLVLPAAARPKADFAPDARPLTPATTPIIRHDQTRQ